MFLMSPPATTSLTCPVEASFPPRPGGTVTTTRLAQWPRPPLTPPYQAQTGTCSFLSRRDLSSGFSSQCSRPHNGGSSQAAPGGCHPGTCRRQVSGWALAPGWGYKLHQDKHVWTLHSSPAGPRKGRSDRLSTPCPHFLPCQWRQRPLPGLPGPSAGTREGLSFAQVQSKGEGSPVKS